MSEGVIRFSLNWEEKELEQIDVSLSFQQWRKWLYSMNWIGLTEDNIGYGNLSIRKEQGFLITGSGTGAFDTLTKNQYAFVPSWNIEKNTVDCVGKIKASSESLSHAAVYEALPQMGAVIHIHDSEYWKLMVERVPLQTTTKNAEYGTVELAKEIKSRCLQNLESTGSVLALGGHEDGILAYAKTMNEAVLILLKQARSLGRL